MRIFQHETRERNARTRRAWAIYEVVYTCVDFGAAICFTVGSVMFFWAALEVTATWFFTVGSVLFLAKPAIRLLREIRLLRLGEYETLAERAEE